MRYVEAREPGPPDVLQLAETAVPKPRADEVLIEVAYAGVNRPDCSQRAGSYPPPPDASPIIGLEVAGKIVAVGEGVRDWRIGDAVCALTPGGGYAEYCATPAAFCLPFPRGLSALEAAGLPGNYFTVWNNVDRAHLAAGETIPIHGGSRRDRARGDPTCEGLRRVRVITTVGSAEAAFCRDIGADHVVNYREQDFVAEARVITGSARRRRARHRRRRLFRAEPAVPRARGRL
jgi:NADPH:quinone reductase-like Zn-dependent oxidoreductase